MQKTFRLIRRCLAGLWRRDWRRILGWVLASCRVLARWVWISSGRLTRRGLVLCHWALRIGGRAAGHLLRWCLRHPRNALGAGSGIALAVAVLIVFWPERTVHLDLSKNLDCLALNIYHEARGEPREGQVAVGQVVMNRVGDAEFPGQVCEVVRQGGERPRDSCQFSWWCDGRSDRPDDLAAWTGSKDLARLILKGAVADPTGGALWYHADYVSPHWDMDSVARGKIGRHVFYGRK